MILVTGGAGYVGSHFVRAFLAENQEERVVVIDNLSKGHRQALPQSDRLVLIVCDLGDSEKIGAAMSKYPVDLVVHFAAKADVGESQKDPFAFMRNNITESLILFEHMEKQYAAWEATMLPEDPQANSSGFSGSELADHFEVPGEPSRPPQSR